MGFPRQAPEELQRKSEPPRIAANGIAWLPVSEWDFPWLWAGFSTRRQGRSRAWCAEDEPGELNLGLNREEDAEITFANRRLFAEAVTGNPQTPLLTLRQIHSKHLVTIRDQGSGVRDQESAVRDQRSGIIDRGSEIRDRKAPIPTAEAGIGRGSGRPAKGDGLLTRQAGLLLAIQTADCIPVLVADRRIRAVAAFHAGWRGTVNRIVEGGIGRMRLEFGSRPEDLIATIGPGIGACCYAVGEEVLSEFESQFAYAPELFREVYDTDPVRQKYPMLFLTQRAPGHSPIGPSMHLDLVEANRRQLLGAGLKPRSIQIVGGCTACQRELFFSHRASHGHAGRMMAVIGMRAEKSEGSHSSRKRRG